MKTKSISFAFAMFLLFSISAFTAVTELRERPVTLTWSEKGVKNKTHTETLYCTSDCETLIDKHIKEIENSGGLTLRVREGKE